MFTKKPSSLVVVVFLSVSGLLGGLEIDSRDSGKKPQGFKLDFVAYAGIGAGVSDMAGEILPRLDCSSGIQFKPWLSIGAFFLVSPLSDFGEVDFGISVADEPNAFTSSSGIEILITPWAKSVVHPMLRMTTGGTTVGYGVDLDGEAHSLEQITGERFFSASLSGGLEFSFGKHFHLSGTAGWRFIGNCEYLGIDAGSLSGFEFAISSRVVWHTIID